MGRRGVAVTFLEDEARDMESMKQIEKEFNMKVELVSLTDKEAFEKKVNSWLKWSTCLFHNHCSKWMNNKYFRFATVAALGGFRWLPCWVVVGSLYMLKRLYDKKSQKEEKESVLFEDNVSCQRRSHQRRRSRMTILDSSMTKSQWNRSWRRIPSTTNSRILSFEQCMRYETVDR